MPKRRVLIADDEPQLRSLVKRFLLASCFEVVEAKDGLEALEAVQCADGSFDLLITDLVMPRMDGIALAHSVASLFPALPVLLMSGYAAYPDYLKIAGAKGAGTARWEFLEKPFQAKELLRKIAALLPDDTKDSAAGS